MKYLTFKIVLATGIVHSFIGKAEDIVKLEDRYHDYSASVGIIELDFFDVNVRVLRSAIVSEIIAPVEQKVDKWFYELSSLNK